MWPYVPVNSALVSDSSQSMRMLRSRALSMRVFMAEAFWSAPRVLRALQEAQLFELLECGFHRRFGGLGIDVKGVDNLVCDLPSRPLTVALVPDEAGGLVELVNQIRLTVQHHRLAVDETGTDVRSSLRVFGHPNH